MLKKLKRFLPPAKLMMVMDGIFGSKLAYGMTVWGRVWQIPGTQEEDTRSSSITKEDIRKIQVLQNKCLRIVTNSDYKTPTAALLQKTNRLSVHQQIAHLCLSEVFSIRQSKAPSYQLQETVREAPQQHKPRHQVQHRVLCEQDRVQTVSCSSKFLLSFISSVGCPSK